MSDIRCKSKPKTINTIKRISKEKVPIASIGSYMRRLNMSSKNYSNYGLLKQKRYKNYSARVVLSKTKIETQILDIKHNSSLK